MAAAQGAEVFCLTDHDSVAGYAATRAALPGCTVLRAAELSCSDEGRLLHVLLYGISDGEALARLEGQLEGLMSQRRQRIRRICGRLRALGVKLDAEAILRKTDGRVPGRPDVARALVEAGVVSSLKEAFSRLLRDGGPADVPSPKLPLADALALGRGAGARMALAHPHTCGELAVVRDLLVRMRGEGLSGLEAFYGGYGAAEREPWLGLARELDLVVTGGSDYHGELLPNVSRPVIDLPEPYASRALEWLGVA
jgi:predicted metal-dependent phosphoesterase TrpH